MGLTRQPVKVSGRLTAELAVLGVVIGLPSVLAGAPLPTSGHLRGLTTHAQSIQFTTAAPRSWPPATCPNRSPLAQHGGVARDG